MAITDDFNNQPLTQEQQAALIARMQAAWAKLSLAQQDQLKPMLDNANQQLSQYLTTGRPPDHDVRSILRMKSYLTNDYEGQTRALMARAAVPPGAAGALEVGVTPGGEILGTGKYEVFDLLWELVAGTVWLENILFRHKFPGGTPAPVIIPDKVTIAMAGDFGTGNFGASDSPSTKISKFIPTLNPDITIHLGDVYYAGTSGEEQHNLLNYWPKGSFGSFALNSNHEMYSGGGPYFNEAVGGPIFNKYQSPRSFFSLENKNWIIVGLDSAYEAGAFELYMDGKLGDTPQLAWLKGIAQRAMQARQRVILLTHHNGLPEDGNFGNRLGLYNEVMSAFSGFDFPAYWYWGHVHAGVAYKPDGNLVLCRCAGHAALPWGLASELKNNPNVDWYESCSANDPDSPLRVYNGFVLLKFDGANMAEAFYDETGRVAWTPQGGDPRGCAK